MVGNDPIVYEDFFSIQEIESMDEICRDLGTDIDWHAPMGYKFDGELIGKFRYLTRDNAPLIYQTMERVKSLFPREVKINEILYSNLYLPWDVHTDYVRNWPGQNPAGNFCVPLEDIDSRTIFFDQRGEYNEFYKYKESHGVLEDCLTEEFWDEHLNYCWPHDRQYLSSSYPLTPYHRRGQCIFIPRDLFHSSDNFHTRCPVPKRFLQVITDYV